MRTFLYRVWLKVRENQFTVELTLWTILLAMIGWEITLIRGEISTAVQQMDLLRRNAEAATRQAQLLDSMMQEQQKSLRILERMNETLQRELGIIAADQNRRLEELAKKPEIEFLVGGVPLSATPPQAVPYRELSQTRMVLELTVLNSGDATAREGTIRVMVDKPDVKLTCSLPFSEIPVPAGEQSRGILIHFDRLGMRTHILLVVTVDYPAGSKQFRIGFNVDAENFPRRWMGQIEVNPPAQN